MKMTVIPNVVGGLVTTVAKTLGKKSAKVQIRMILHLQLYCIYKYTRKFTFKNVNFTI